MRIAINGFGRIGRSVFRILNDHSDLEVVAINDLSEREALVYLLKYDTVMGRFPDEVELAGDVLKTSNTPSASFPAQIRLSFRGETLESTLWWKRQVFSGRTPSFRITFQRAPGG